MNQETETRILDMLSEISSRLTILEETNQAAYNNTINNELDNLMEEDNSVMRKPSRKGSSTLHIAENYNPVNNYSSTLNIPAFDNQLMHLKPRAVIRFTAAAHTYEYTYGLKINMSKSFRYEIQQQLCSCSEGQYNMSTIGTITLKDFIKITRKFLQVYTQASFIKQLTKSSYFPATVIKDLNLEALPTFRNLIKQYSEEFIMLVDLLSNNVESIPPIVNTKDLGLIWQFNRSIPFGFGEGLYRQIGFKDGKKITFKNINEYCELVNKRMDEFYEYSNLIIPFFDAITNPNDKPKELKITKENIKNINLFEDGEDDSRTTFSTNSLLSDIDVVNVVPAPMNRPKFQASNRPCFRIATDGICEINGCKYSHDTDQIKKCRQELMAKLKKLDNT